MNSGHEFITTAAKITLNSAEEYFKIGLFDAAIRSAEAAKTLNPELNPMADSFISAYRVHLVSLTNKGSLYEVLGTSEVKASLDVIKRQYKRMALLLHPDKNTSIASEDAFKIVRQASDVLTDEAKRCDCKNGFRSSVVKQTPPNPFKRAAASSSSSPSNRQKAAANDHQQAAGTAKQKTKPCSSSRPSSGPAAPPPSGFGSGSWVGIDLESLTPGASVSVTVKRSCRSGQTSFTVKQTKGIGGAVQLF